ncbi:MAG: acyl-CoA desaturase [Alphaproteobacteria bacterium]|nr:acyl-CoA desaturase [Alphaproteobacteria bacterium]
MVGHSLDGKTRDEPRFLQGSGDAVAGDVIWSPSKTVFLCIMYAGTVAGFFCASWDAVALFLVTTAGVLCFGHSLGMHRRLIHNSYNCPKWLERAMVYLGTLVGLGGPRTMVYTHDMRDWAQRQSKCHDYFAHRKDFWQDGFWQLGCDIRLAAPPVFVYERHLQDDKFYAFIDRWAKWQNLPWAILFYMLGGWPYVFWGVCARVAACMTGHWLIGYYAHREGHQSWRVTTAGVQGYNVKFAGLITFGESWHNNHHAFPGSARIGLYDGEADPGWWVLRVFESMGLAWDIKQPRDLAARPELVRA